jgi:hypothetical protein
VIAPSRTQPHGSQLPRSTCPAWTWKAASDAGEVATSDASPNCAALVTGTGGLRLLGRPTQLWPSDRACGAILLARAPDSPKRPARGAGMPPKASHGEDPWRRSLSDFFASASLTGSGLEPPSMNTRPDSPFAPGLPWKSHVA